MEPYCGTSKARFEVTSKEQRDVFTVLSDYFLVHCMSADLNSKKGIARIFYRKFGQSPELTYISTTVVGKNP